MIRKARLGDEVRLAEIHIFGWRMVYRGIIPYKILFKIKNVSEGIKNFKKIIVS